MGLYMHILRLNISNLGYSDVVSFLVLVFCFPLHSPLLLGAGGLMSLVIVQGCQ